MLNGIIPFYSSTPMRDHLTRDRRKSSHQYRMTRLNKKMATHSVQNCCWRFFFVKHPISWKRSIHSQKLRIVLCVCHLLFVFSPLQQESILCHMTWRRPANWLEKYKHRKREKNVLIFPHGKYLGQTDKTQNSMARVNTKNRPFFSLSTQFSNSW